MNMHKTLNELFQSIQVQNQFLSRANETTLSLAESHILVEVDAAGQDGIAASILATVLGLSKVQISRLIDDLGKHTLLGREVSKSDGRSKLVRLTESGRTALARFDQSANESMERLAGRLSESELLELKDLFKRFSDALGAAPSKTRTSDHPLRNEIRRVTRVLGLLGRKIYHSDKDLNSLDFFVLKESAKETDGGCLPSDLAEKFSLPRTTISGSIKRLSALRLVTQKKDVNADKRQLPLFVTEEGTSTLEAVESSGCALIERGTADFSISELDRFVHLVKLFATPREKTSRITLQSKMDIVELSDKADIRNCARSFLLEGLVSKGWHKQAPEGLLLTNNLVTLLYVQDSLQGVLELSVKQSMYYLQNFFIEKSFVGSVEGRKFLKGSFEMLNVSSQQISVSDTYISAALKELCELDSLSDIQIDR